MPSPALFQALFGRPAGAAQPIPAECGTDVMSRGVSWLEGKLRAYAAKPIVYRRGESATSLCATPGQTLLKLADDFGSVRLEWTDRDMVVSASDLVLDGVPVRPQRGDVIEYVEDGNLNIFEVLPFGTEPHWRFADPYQKLIRIHLKRIRQETA